MRAAWSVAALGLLAAGCLQGSDQLPTPTDAWTAHGPAFPGARHAAVHEGRVAVLGQALWTWQPTATEAREFPLPPCDGAWRGVGWDGEASAWTVACDVVRAEMYATPCDDFPGCHGDGIRHHVRATVYLLAADGLHEAWNATSSGGPGDAPEVPSLAHGPEPVVGGTPYRIESGYHIASRSGGQWQREGELPCVTRWAWPFTDGKRLYVHAVGHEHDSPRCHLVASHVLRWAGDHWQAMAEPAPTGLGSRVVLGHEGRLWFLGEPTYELRPQGPWWDLVLDTEVSVERGARAGQPTLRARPVEPAWPANVTATWTWPGGSQQGWTAHVPADVEGDVHVRVEEDGFGLSWETTIPRSVLAR
jgi:hypothetical protein